MYMVYGRIEVTYLAKCVVLRVLEHIEVDISLRTKTHQPMKQPSLLLVRPNSNQDMLVTKLTGSIRA
jgi:hypothetical protein